MLHVGGRPGQGPGEFGWLWWADDCTTESIFAYDAATRRIAMFSAELKHLRTVRVSAPGMTYDGLQLQPQAARCAGPTTLLVFYWTVDFNTSPGPHRPTMVLGKHSLLDGSFQGIIGDDFLGDERYRFELSDGPLQWGKVTVLAALPDGGFVLGTGDGGWLTRHSMNGVLLDTIRLGATPPVRVSKSEIEDLQDWNLEAARRRGANLAKIRQQHREYRYPEHYPPYSKLFLSADSKLWIQAYPTPQNPASHQWVVATVEGELIATVEVPRYYDVLWADGDYVAGVARDDLGTEFVEMREIIPG